MTILPRLLLLSALAVGAAVAEKFTSPSGGANINTGSRTTIRWTGAGSSSTVQLQLCHYRAENDVSCNNLDSTENNGSYDWTPSGSLESGSYFILMFGDGGTRLDTSPNFNIRSGSGGSSASSASGSSPTSGSGGSSPTTGGAGGDGTTPAPSLAGGAGGGGTQVVTLTVTGADGSMQTLEATVTGAPSGGSSGGGGGVSKGTLGGAIGGTLGGIALLAIGALLLFRHRKHKKQREQAEREAQDLEKSAGENGAAAAAAHKDEKRNSKLLNVFRHSKQASAGSHDAKDVIPEPQGVLEMPENPVYEMPADNEPVEVPDHRFYAMELDSREILPPSKTANKPTPLDPKELRRGDHLSPGIALSPPLDGSFDKTAGERPKEGAGGEALKTVEEVKPEDKNVATNAAEAKAEEPGESSKAGTEPIAEDKKAEEANAKPEEPKA